MGPHIPLGLSHTDDDDAFYLFLERTLDCSVLPQNINEQTEANEAALEHCSSVSISPLLLVVEQFRAGKRSLMILAYHSMRVSWRVLEVFIAVTADAAASLADTTSNAVQLAAEALLTEVTALMLVIGDFV